MNLVRTGLLLAALTGLFLALGFLLGGRGGALIALVLALGMNLFAFWGSDQMVLRMHNARQVTRDTAPDLHDLVARLAMAARLPMPKVYVIETEQPNAFATGRDPAHAAVAVTRGIMRSLSRDELAGVVAHELAHVRNRDTLTMAIAATLAGAIGFLANFAFFFGGAIRSDERSNPVGAILLAILAPIGAMLVQMAISRTREFSADRLGAQICGHPRWLASALRRIEGAAQATVMPSAETHPASAHLFIVNPLHARGLANLFRTHPPTEERVAALMRLEGAAASGGRPTTAAGAAAGPWGAPRGSTPSGRTSVPGTMRGDRP